MRKLNLQGLTKKQHLDNLFYNGKDFFESFFNGFKRLRIGQQKGNYKQIYLTDPNAKKKGQKIPIRIHRLLAFNFLPFPEGYSKMDYDILHVHHKDNNRNNNSLDNLEILPSDIHYRITASDNSNPVYVTTLHDNQTYFFQTTSEASHFLKRSVSKVGRYKSGGILNGCYVKVEDQNYSSTSTGLFHTNFEQ